jgi:hypothetical protein
MAILTANYSQPLRLVLILLRIIKWPIDPIRLCGFVIALHGFEEGPIY